MFTKAAPPKAATRDRILDAAYDAYLLGGADGISMRGIAAVLDLTAPALYKHFNGKDAVIEAVAERGFALFERRIAALEMAADPEARITALLDAYILFALQKPHLFDIMFVTPRTRLRRFPDDFAAGRSMTFTLLRSHVDAGIAAKALRADNSLEIARDLWAFAHGYVALYRAGRFGTDRRAFTVAFGAGLPRLLAGLRVQKGAKR